MRILKFLAVAGTAVAYAVTKTQAYTSITPLNNLDALQCGTTLGAGKDGMPTVIIGFTGCPYYSQLLPVFADACAQLPQRDCYSFNFTSELDTLHINPIFTRTAQFCLSFIPWSSPIISQYMITSSEPELGPQAFGPFNLGGRINGNSTVEEVKDFINEFGAPNNHRNLMFSSKKTSIPTAIDSSFDVSDEEMAASVFAIKRK